MEILYSDDQCGAGKTTWALTHMARDVGRYVYVVDRREVAESRREGILAAAGPEASPHIETVFSEDASRERVERRISEAGDDLRLKEHVILMITSAGMRRLDTWSNFEGWDAILIDEIPNIIEHEVRPASPLDRVVLEAFYELEPTERAGESRIRFVGGYSSNDLRNHPLLKFHQRVMTGDAICDVECWDDLEDRAEWSSWTVWDARKLKPFGARYVLGDSLRDTDTYHLMAGRGGIVFKRFHVAAPRRWAQRSVTIRYVSSDIRASSARLKADRNSAQLLKIGAWLAGAGTDQHLWTCNAHTGIVSGLEACNIPGQRVSPKQAGSNQWCDWHAASAIYSAKPSPEERRFFEQLGVDPDIIVGSRETYDIRQFFMRTSLRDPMSTAPVTLRVLDRFQAEAFAAYLLEHYGIEAELVHDDIGLSFVEHKRGPKSGRGMSKEQSREADRLRKVARRAKLREQGLSTRGRPLSP